jgi:hypothetical protein
VQKIGRISIAPPLGTQATNSSRLSRLRCISVVLKSVSLTAQAPESLPAKRSCLDPLSVNRSRIPLHQIKHIVKERVCLRKVGVPQQIDVEIWYLDSIDSTYNCVRRYIAGPWGAVKHLREKDGQIVARSIQGGASAMARKKARHFYEYVAINVRSSKENLLEL